MLGPLVDRYHGVDIVDSVIKANQEQFADGHVSFQCLDLSVPDQQKQLRLTQTDLVVCLDVFGHLLNPEVDSLLGFIIDDLDARLFLVTNRRDAHSMEYLCREKTRNEGIDLEQHRLFLQHHPNRLKQTPALGPNDFFDLYDLR